MNFVNIIDTVSIAEQFKCQIKNKHQIDLMSAAEDGDTSPACCSALPNSQPITPARRISNEEDGDEDADAAEVRIG